MDAQKSSANPEYLLTYCTEAQKIAASLIGHHTHITNALQHFQSTCTEFSVPLNLAELPDNLTRLIGFIQQGDMWVQGVALAFLTADENTSGHDSSQSSNDASSGFSGDDHSAEIPVIEEVPTEAPASLTAEQINQNFAEWRKNPPARAEMVKYFPSGFSGLLAKIVGQQAVDMTAGEAEMLDALWPGEKKDFKDIADLAFDTEAEYFNTLNDPDYRPNNDGPADAFRHAYWSGLLTREFGADWAQRYTDAHEEIPGNSLAREYMDRTNNALGIKIAQENPDASEEELAQLIFTAIQDGRGVYIVGANDHKLQSAERDHLIENGPLAPTNEQLGPNDNMPAGPPTGTDS